MRFRKRPDPGTAPAFGLRHEPGQLRIAAKHEAHDVGAFRRVGQLERDRRAEASRLQERFIDQVAAGYILQGALDRLRHLGRA